MFGRGAAASPADNSYVGAKPALAPAGSDVDKVGQVILAAVDDSSVNRDWLRIVARYRRIGAAHPELSDQEVFRRAVGKTPLHPEDPRIIAIASDQDFPAAGIPRVDINDIEGIAEMVLARAEPLEKVIAALEG